MAVFVHIYCYEYVFAVLYVDWWFVFTRCGGTPILLQLDECEAMSVVFLALQGNLLARHGYKLSQYLCRGQEKVTLIPLAFLFECI